MKEVPLMDVFDNADFNPELILSSVFMDPSLDFVAHIDEIGDNMMVPDMLGNSVFYSPNIVSVNNNSIVNLTVDECNQQIEQILQNHRNHEDHQRKGDQQTTTLKVSRSQATVEKNVEKLNCDSYESEFARQFSTAMSVAKGIQSVQQQVAQQQSVTIGLLQQQQSCKCEFCEYLQANRISLTGDHSFQCEFCGEGFSNQANFNQHRCGSTDIHFHRCESCQREYGSLRTTSSLGICEQRNKCDLCDQSNPLSHSEQQTYHSSAQLNTTDIIEVETNNVVSEETYQIPLLGDESISCATISTPVATSSDVTNASVSDLIVADGQQINSSSNQQANNDTEQFGSNSDCIGDFFARVSTESINSDVSRTIVSSNERNINARYGVPTSVPRLHLPESSKTYFILGNVEQSQQGRIYNNANMSSTQSTSGSSQNLHISPGVASFHQQSALNSVAHESSISILPSGHEVTCLHQNDQYDDEDYSSMSEDEAIVPIEPYAKSPKHDQAKTELPIQETFVDTSTSSVQVETADKGFLPTKITSMSQLLVHVTRQAHQYHDKHFRQQQPKQNKIDMINSIARLDDNEDGKCDSSSSLRFFSPGSERVQLQSESHVESVSNSTIERPYKCNVCERSYRNQKNLKSHLKVHEGIRAYQCEICGKHFSGSSYLVIHRRRHTGERPFKCTTCGKAFVDSRALAVHTRLHSGERLKCEKCEKTFSSVSALTVHNRLHTGIHPYKCELCFKTFPQYNNLKHHMKKHNLPHVLNEKESAEICSNGISSTFSSSAAVMSSNCSVLVGQSTQHQNTTENTVASSSTSFVVEHKCHICSKLHKSSDDLQEHLNQHSKDRPNQCEFCSKVFPRSSHLIIHRRRHTGERPFKCKYCEKAFVDSRALSVHTRLHTGERVKCEICEKTFASSSGLIVHRRIHTGIHPYKCDYCDKSFAQSTALKYHLKKHDTAVLPTTTSSVASGSLMHVIRTNNKIGVLSSFLFAESSSSTETSDRHKCLVCNKLFRSTEYLARHRRTHNGERPYQCEICGKNFSTMSYLVIHRRRHTSERPYKCNSCEKGFVDSRALQEHARLHNGDRVRCEICQKTYSSVSNLIVHRRIHSGIHPFECDNCGKSFAQKNALKYHLKKHLIQQ